MGLHVVSAHAQNHFDTNKQVTFKYDKLACHISSDKHESANRIKKKDKKAFTGEGRVQSGESANLPLYLVNLTS